MLENLGTIFAYLMTLIAFGALRATAMYGFLQAEKAIRRSGPPKPGRAPSMDSPAVAQR